MSIATPEADAAGELSLILREPAADDDLGVRITRGDAGRGKRVLGADVARWTDSLSDPRGILRIYRGDPPALRSVSIHEVTAHRDGPALLVRLDLPRFPDDPPATWLRSGYNTVQLQLRFTGVEDLLLRGFAAEIVAEVTLTGRDPVRLEVASAQVQLSASAAFVDVVKISAYCDGAVG